MRFEAFSFRSICIDGMIHAYDDEPSEGIRIEANRAGANQNRNRLVPALSVARAGSVIRVPIFVR
jgi:hypothetical protein